MLKNAAAQRVTGGGGDDVRGGRGDRGRRLQRFHGCSYRRYLSSSQAADRRYDVEA